MTMVIKKPKEKRFGKKKVETKKTGSNAEEPKQSDAVMLLFSASVLAAAILLFVVLIHQPTPHAKLKTNERLTLHSPGDKGSKSDTP